MRTGNWIAATAMVCALLAAPALAEEPSRTGLTAGEPPRVAQESPPLYLLLPHDYPYPLIRTCYTSAGICLIPFTIQPGTPCFCEGTNGVRVSGVCTK